MCATWILFHWFHNQMLKTSNLIGKFWLPSSIWSDLLFVRSRCYPQQIEHVPDSQGYPG
jgi:hypothetical protein